MSDQGAEIYEDGSSVWPLEGGGFVAFGPSGEPLEAVDETGAAIDHENILHPDLAEYYEPEGYEPPAYDPRLDDLAGRLDQLNERIETANTRALSDIYVPHRQTHEQMLATAEHQRAHVEGMLGRTLTNRESREGFTRAVARAEATGEDLDLMQAFADAGDEGQPILLGVNDDASDYQRAEARQAVMRERLADADGSSGDPVTGEVERRAEVYDTSRHEDRVAAVLDAMDGHGDVRASTYDPADYPDDGDAA